MTIRSLPFVALSLLALFLQPSLAQMAAGTGGTTSSTDTTTTSASASASASAAASTAATAEQPTLSSIQKAYDLPNINAVTADKISFGAVANLDGDQRIIVARLAGETDAGFSAAQRVFEKGAASDAYALLSIENPAFADTFVPPMTQVIGLDARNQKIMGIAKTGSDAGETTIGVHYPAEDLTGTETLCSVGGNPNPITDGCFAASGSVSMEVKGVNAVFAYTYNPFTDNANGLSLSNLDDLRSRTDTLHTYLDYYTSPSYDKEWINAAFEGRSTVGYSNGAMDFSKLDKEGRREAIEVGMVVLRLFVFIANSLEDAVAKCGNPDSLSRWDDAVAAYAGATSIQGFLGFFFYGLAETECKNFGTCFPSEAGMIPLNKRVFDHLKFGKDNLAAQECQSAADRKSQIIPLMTIPIVQGLLRNAHELDVRDNSRGEIQGQAAAYAAAILPLMHKCSAGNAFIVYDDLAPGKAEGASFEVLQGALERSYECLGISCEEVGGLLTLAGDGYLPGAGPCGTNRGSTTDTTTTSNNNTPVSTPVSNAPPTEVPWSPMARPTAKPTAYPALPATPVKEKKAKASYNNQNALVIGLSVGAGVLALLVAIIVGIRDHKQAKQFDTNREPTNAAEAATTEAAKQREGDEEEGEETNTGEGAATATTTTIV